MLPQGVICFILLFIDFKSAFYVTGLWGWSYFLNQIIKVAVKRPRPDASKHRVHVSGYSFPSGHSLTSFTIYFSIAKYFHPEPLMLYTLLSLPFLLGLSRVYLRVHNVSDVIGGWAIAYIYLLLCEDFLNYAHSYFYKYVYAVFKFVLEFWDLILKALHLS